MKPGLDTVTCRSSEWPSLRRAGSTAALLTLLLASGGVLAHGGGGGGGGGGEGSAAGAYGGSYAPPPPGLEGVNPNTPVGLPPIQIGGNLPDDSIPSIRAMTPEERRRYEREIRKLLEQRQRDREAAADWENKKGWIWGWAEWAVVNADRAGQVSQAILSAIPGVGQGTNITLTGTRGFAEAYRDARLKGASRADAIKAGLANVAAQVGLSLGLGKATGSLSKRLGLLKKMNGVKDIRMAGKAKGIINWGAYIAIQGGGGLTGKMVGDKVTDTIATVSSQKGNGFSNSSPSSSPGYSPSPYHPMAR
ncbi:MAG TPA: hypothetical protein ENI96_13780 [Sedimenticola thiotaurini]|uniref:Uncharacterized protein n=1 Tax=Sedimenticola thiotaurini TaxID=1543721 RepID=A0A831W6Q1_9GAMM|nr:hypothetical protein [Sedimenticola thiotaurini]